MKSATAILFFSRSPEEELLEKEFHQNRSRAYQVAKFLVSRTRNLLKQTGLTVFEVTSAHQTGNSPNERFHNALTHIFSKGYTQVIAVGNDCLQLTIEDIRKAQKALETKSIVLGPDLRGGAFLIGFKRKEYIPKSILQAPWSKRYFLSSISGFYHPSEIEYLQPLADLNGSINELALKNISIRKTFIRTFLTIFRPTLRIPEMVSVWFLLPFSPVTYSRPPPCFS